MTRLILMKATDGKSAVSLLPWQAWKAIRRCHDKWTARRAWRDMVHNKREVYVSARWKDMNFFSAEVEIWD